MWSQSDVIVIGAPTAFGKTAVMVMIARALASIGKSSSLIFPSNVLVDQNATGYPDVAILHRQTNYRCEDQQRSCGETKAKRKYFCKECPYTCAKDAAKKGKIRASNYHIYLANKLFSDVLIVDEAHKVIDFLEDARVIKLWRHIFKFPTNFRTVADVISWAQKQPRSKQIKDLIDELVQIRSVATVDYTTDYYRGHPEELLRITVSDTSRMPPMLWPSKVKKIVLLSATIGPKDVEAMGLANRRVAFIEGESPIPPSNRRVYLDPRVNMGSAHQIQALPVFADLVRETLAAHPYDKGLLHVPYSLAARLRPLLHDEPRLLWHTRDNKADVLGQFRDSPEPSVLVASGLYEGVDLPYDAARFQIIGKAPFPSMGDEYVRARMQKDQDWLAWETLKKLIQALGRTTRTPDDHSVNYAFDIHIERLFRENPAMIPAWLKPALIFPPKK